MAETHPRAPAGLERAGKSLWARMVTTYVFQAHELIALELAARQIDDLARLEALLTEQGVVVAGSAGQPRLTPVLAELRQSRLALSKLLGAMALPDEADKPMTEAGRRGQRAATARWAKKRAIADRLASAEPGGA